MKGWRGLAAGAAALAVAVAGCGTSSDKGSGDSGDAKTLTVWLMDGSAPSTLTEALHKEFEAAHPGVTVKYDVQKWPGIQEKLTTALSSNNPPDVIELGNTQTAKFAAEETLLDLSGDVSALNGDQWLGGLKDSLTWDGKQYGMPFYAANRTVVYRTDLFQAAGIQDTPKSRDEWIAAIEKLKTANAADPEFQSLYLPGQSWYALLSFIWDEGGDVAKAQGSAWAGALNTPEAKAGLDFYKKLVDTSATKAPKDTDEAQPQQYEVFAKGKVGMMIALPWELGSAVKADPTLKDKTAAFPIPSKTAGKTAPVFLGGSNVAVTAGSKNQDLAKDYLKLLSSKKYQDQLAEGGAVPGTSTDTTKLASSPLGKALAESAPTGKVTPTTPSWAGVEAGQNPLKDMLTAYLTGAKSLDQATSDANAALSKTLGG
ncbi:sugar ABC transporter substrate-binding protein [Saccharothrix australiensis]|uniref:Carbohydrate ABC transporter substrate-binding protein (CUT1 family) n=1 Tax=Saccharothrix australiensis TaxID=2072 RepID=A0A495VUU7_9PSEU|nr:sugar ABC transporter substrate-binding protein [Saccharothrix australiensis]RKT52253.1 carbohydrate ABC transporter substrate-binding protein (CUT1 family) [Saccharothrix australiensis]